MHFVYRWLLISCLIMALPLKGLAAAGYLGCDPVHARSAAMAHAHPVAQPEAHEHGDHAGSEGEVPAQSAEPTADAGALPEQPSEQLPAKPALKCMQCAPCCGAAAPPGDAPLPLSLAGPTELKVAVRLLELGGDAGRLDRPPRNTLV